MHNNQPNLGMWSWNPSHFDTSEALNEMLEFCAKENISHIDQHIDIEIGTIQNAKALKRLVVKAHELNITVNALRGQEYMFFEINHEFTLADIRAIIEFNLSLPENTRLAGIKFDVEPYKTPEWKAGGKQKKKVILDYLDFLIKAKAYMNDNAPNLELAVDVPFWWDDPNFEIDFRDKQNILIHHIQDIVDWIGIMSYRRNPDQIIRLIQKESDYAEKCGYLNSVAPAMETGKTSEKEAHISFGNVPPEQFRTALSKLRKTLAGNPMIRCIMLHHYGSLRTYLQETLSK